jgi:hypothetical protein
VAPPVVVQPQYYPVYVPAPVYRAPVHYRPVYHAPKRVIVIKERVIVPPGHVRHGHPGRGWRLALSHRPSFAAGTPTSDFQEALLNGRVPAELFRSALELDLPLIHHVHTVRERSR